MKVGQAKPRGGSDKKTRGPNHREQGTNVASGLVEVILWPEAEAERERAPAFVIR